MIPKNDKTSTDGFDPSELRLSQGFADMVGVKRHILNIAVRKPHRQDFIRVHPDPEYREVMAILDDSDEKIAYVVHPSICNEIDKDIVPKMVHVAINKQGAVFLWPIRMPDANGRLDAWNTSAFEAAKMAENSWVRVVSNMHSGSYEVYEATSDMEEPDWPDLSYGEILAIALKDRLIDSLDHHVLKKLRGEL